MSIDFDNVPGYIRKEIDAPKRVVTKGKRGGPVKQIQEWLNFHGFRTSIDTVYGPATASCVKDFQQKNDLSATGRVNKDTWDALVSPLRNALTEPKNVRKVSPARAVLAAANQHVDAHPIEIGGANRGPWVRVYCKGNDGTAWAWCAGFVTLVMHQAYFYRGEKAPIKGSVSCDSLAAQAKAAGLFVAEREITSGRTPWKAMGESSVFLRRRTDTDWTHTGISTVAEGTPKQLVFSTIEGNTNDEGSREGFEACRRKRSVATSNYDFITFE